jgi:hypothetical protein
VLAPEIKHGIKRIEKTRSENCPDLENQESFAERNETFDKNRVYIYKYFGSPSPFIFEN